MNRRIELLELLRLVKKVALRSIYFLVRRCALFSGVGISKIYQNGTLIHQIASDERVFSNITVDGAVIENGYQKGGQ